MTFRTWLGRQLRDLLTEPVESPPIPPTPSPESIPTSPTSSTRTSAPTSEAAVTSLQIVELVAAMQRETMTEMRGMVMDILQGRERPPMSEEEQLLASRTPFDPPDYDAPGTEDLPGGIRDVFEREDREDTEYRTYHSEQELLNDQLRRAREAAGLDAQGPTRDPSFSTESLGLQWDERPAT